MLSPKFLAAISRFLPRPNIPAFRIEALSGLDPHHIYVENVRSILGVSTTEAAAICENAAQQGLFQKKVDVRCPDGAVVATAPSEQELPPTVYCWDGQEHPHELEVPTSNLKKTVFYVLNE